MGERLGGRERRLRRRRLGLGAHPHTADCARHLSPGDPAIRFKKVYALRLREHLRRSCVRGETLAIQITPRKGVFPDNLGMDDDARGCCTSRLDATTGAWYWRRGRLVAVVAICSLACILGDVMLASVTPHTIKQAKRTLSGFDTLTSVTTDFLGLC